MSAARSAPARGEPVEPRAGLCPSGSPARPEPLERRAVCGGRTVTGEVLRLGLIGAGRIGRLHAEHLAHRVPRARLLVVADVVEEAAAACAREFGVARATCDYRDVLASPEVDAVVICSSTDTHALLIQEAAR